MDFAFTEKQRRLREERARSLTENSGATLSGATVAALTISPTGGPTGRNARSLAVLGACVPTTYGGQGHDALTTVLLLEALGEGCPDNGLTLGLNGQMWAVQTPILEFGTEEQKRRYLPGLCSGALIGAHGMTEYASGSDIAALSTTAERCDDAYVLNGVKTYVGLAPVCDMAIVFATVDPSKGAWGISAFLVDADTPGFTRPSAQEKMGLRTAPMGEIVLEDCRVSSDALLGREGGGSAIFQHAMEWERSFIFASHVGSMARQLDECLAYAGERVVFGSSIDAFQSVLQQTGGHEASSRDGATTALQDGLDVV